ncbi:hypothetical protein QBC41DRAFT_230201 [Cercophora samala]|uniref:F-box domain-containing protein n=1 Tax=Cercophora samala TaxID=330535 RepID=A0AA39Z9A6_9PEZI|nr:hypothetical protein QBC41DRAFT_230201 [Cercophora samala]
MTMTLIKFPLEILLQVCELLGDTHESSLLSFALTNKYCYSIASRLLFRTITFNITTLSRFRNDIRQCIRILRRDKAFQHVHRLVLSGCYDTFKLHKPSEDETEIDEGHAKPFNLHGWNLGPPLSVNWDVRHKRLRGIPDHSDFTNEIYAAKAAVNDVYEDDARWTPLADLIGLLPALDDLIYECPTQFPPCLLQALHTSPNDRVARLHLHTFKLRMLGRVDLATPVGATRDAHELALIKSPCLHAIWLSDRDERLTPEQEGESRLVGRQFDALEQILGNEGLAPNLREIRRKVTHSSSFDYLQPRPYTSGWLPKEVGPRSGKQQPAALRHLQLDCSMSHHQILGFQIHRWARLANLRSLETLELTTHVTECGLDAILSLDFPALRTLSFRCARDPDIGYHSKVKRFLARLPRLESLWIRGWDWSLASLAPDLDNGTTNDKDTSPTMAILRTLSPELLHQVCELLYEEHRPSLVSFALASKQCHAIAGAYLFRRLTFNITTPTGLQKHTAKCIEILQRNHAFQHVRCVVLVGFYDEGFGMYERPDPPFPFGRDEYRDEHVEMLWNTAPAPSLEWEVNNARLHGIPDYSKLDWRRVPISNTPASEAYDMDEPWDPMAKLISRLPGLREVIYQCPVQFPPCLLQALHNKMPQTIPRLHLRTFELRVLNDTTTADTDLDPHELALITSPCVRRIWLMDINNRGRNATMDPKKQDVFCRVMRNRVLVPNLDGVCLVEHQGFLPDNSSHNIVVTMLKKAAKEKTCIRLKELFLDCAYLNDITTLGNALDLSLLRVLHLTKMHQANALDALETSSLPMLRDLSIECTFSPVVLWDAYDKVRQFVRRFGNLESLRVRGWDWSMASFSAWSGDITPFETVRSLWLEGEKEGEIASSIQSDLEIRCLGYIYPGVEVLSLPIRRSKGDMNEVLLYEAIARGFPKLKRLALTLEALVAHVDPPPQAPSSAALAPTLALAPTYPTTISGFGLGVNAPVPDQWLDRQENITSLLPSPNNYTHQVPFEDQPARGLFHFLNGEILDFFVNLALDDKLAREIFNKISSSYHTVSRLETMMVRTKASLRHRSRPPSPEEAYHGRVPGTGHRYGQPVYQERLMEFIYGLERQWRVESLLCDDSGEKVRVKELGPRADGWRGMVMQPLPANEGDPTLKLFRMLWPVKKEGSKGWWEDWESRGLETWKAPRQLK